MEIRDNEKVCIITPLCSKLDSYKIQRIFSRIEKESRKVAIDMSKVQECSIDFFDKLKSISCKDLGIFNISSDIFVLFNIMDIDKYAKIFVSELDFEEDARRLINRKFTII